MKNPADKAKQQLPETKKWVEHFARFGYAAKGTIYVLVGVLSAIAAFSAGGKTTGRKGAFIEIAQQPYGKILLVLVGLGFIGYGVWRFIQSIRDAENKGNKTKGILIRAGYILSGLLYFYFAYYAYQLISVSKSNNGGSKFLVQQMLQWSIGEILVGLLALIVLAKGIYQIYKVTSGIYNKDVKDSQMKDEIKNAYRRLGQVGLISRGVVFAIISFFLAKAAFTSNAAEAKGTSGVFHFLQSTGGPYLMGIIAIGLVGYGIFEFVKAKYKPFNVDE
jgi:uncharacterized membrane protein YidH (DUF202 family)